MFTYLKLQCPMIRLQDTIVSLNDDWLIKSSESTMTNQGLCDDENVVDI